MDEVIEQDIPREDSTPPVVEQADAQSWASDYYDFGKLEGDGNDYFNPGIVERQDGLWLLVRRAEPHPQGFPYGQNSVFAFQLDEAGKVPKMGIRLRWLSDDHHQHFEDPRGFYHPSINQTLIGACTFVWYPEGSWTGAHQVLGAFDPSWECKKMDYPRIGGNPGQMERILDKRNYEKNWLWFLHGQTLHLLYKANPWMLVGFGDRWGERQEFKHDGVSWAYGDIRGGTTPVRVGDYYFTFHHSSLPWKNRYRRYYAGCMAFDANPPFKPRLITREPLLRGSQNDVWAQRKPLVIFPCGAVIRNGKWLISCGVNDMKSAWFEIPHDDILKRMQPIGEVGSTIFSANGLSPQEEQKDKLRRRLSKAREVLAEKRARGEIVKRRKTRRRRKVVVANG